MNALAPLLLLLLGCDREPSTDDVEPADDTVVTDESDTTPEDSDPPEHTDPPVPREDTIGYAGTGPIYCLAPSLRAEARFDQSVARVSTAEHAYVAGGGVGIVDVDGDELFELFAVRQNEVVMFSEDGAGGYLRTVLVTASFEDAEGLFGVSAADYDGDFDLDLYITSYPGRNILLRNDGGKVFTDVAEEAGVAGDSGHHSASSSWGDFDQDGDLDLVVAGHGHVVEDGTKGVLEFDPAEPTLLFSNNGDGTFLDVSHLVPVGARDAYTFNASFVDLDDDGWPEIYFANDFAGQLDPSQCAHNDHGTFSLDNADPSLAVHIVGMGLGIGDANNDGIADLVLPGWRTMGFLASTGGSWFEQSQLVGISMNAGKGQGMAWGTELADLDNDSDLDVLVNYGFLDTLFANNEYDQPDGVYIQDSPTRFIDRATEWGLNQRGPSRGLSVADVNNDGFVDVFKASILDEARIARSRCGDRTWMRVRLEEPGMNRHAVGAKVEIVLGNGTTMSRWVFAGSTGYGSGGPPEVHFGMDSYYEASELRVTWPDGRRDVLYDVPARQVITIQRP